MRKTVLLALLTPTLLLTSVPAAGAASADAAALVSRQGELRVLAGDGLHASRIDDDARFHAVAPLEGDRWIAAGVRDHSKLLVVRGEGDAAERLAVPEVGGSLAMMPVPLTRDGELEGLAWLSGDDPARLSVRFARFEGGTAVGRWSAPERVAGPAKGTQTALSGATLADGSTLLVWSAFDGNDDEILWSRHDGGRWSAPARLANDNRVPDVTPVVAPLGNGAVVAWSRFGPQGGGQYHLTAVRWTGDGWSDPERIGSPGTFAPQVRATADGALLLYRDAPRQGYGVLRLDPEGRVAARAFLSHPSPQGEPALVGGDGQAVRVVPPEATEARELRWNPTY